MGFKGARRLPGWRVHLSEKPAVLMGCFFIGDSMIDSPVIHADIGDGKRRRLFLGADELRIIKRETGRGFYTLYSKFSVDAEPDDVATIVRLSLIGGGMAPQDALELTDYYCRPPRSLKAAYILAYEAMSACWNGFDGAKSTRPSKPLSDEEIDEYFVDLEAAFVKGGADASVLRGKSFAEIQALMQALQDDSEKADMPDAATFAAIKAASKKGAKK